jgi:lysophospholipase L1-like esterase
MRRLVNFILIPLLTFLFLSAMAEIALRIAFARSLDFSMEMWKYAVALKRPVADDNLAFVHAPSSRAFLMGVDVAINAQGLRDRDYVLAKPSSAFRIMILGDSTTFGWGVPAEDTAAKILERTLNADGGDRRFEVINAGVGNYCTVQEVTYYLERGRSFHPDLVVLQYFINDAEPVPREARSFFRDRSYFVAFTVSRFDGMLRVMGRLPRWQDYYASLYQEDQPGWRAAKTAFGDLARQTKSDRTRLLVALLPELHQINGEYPFASEHAQVRSVLADRGVPTLELIDGLRNHGPESSLWITPLDDHPNAKANGLVAAQIKRWILDDIRQSHADAAFTVAKR